MAAAFFRIPKDLMTGSGILSLVPPILKFWYDLWVCAPQYLSSGTSISPNASFSVLIAIGEVENALADILNLNDDLAASILEGSKKVVKDGEKKEATVC